MRDANQQATAVGRMVVRGLRLARRVSPFVWLALGLAFLTPWYLCYVAWVMTRFGGIETFVPRT